MARATGSGAVRHALGTELGISAMGIAESEQEGLRRLGSRRWSVTRGAVPLMTGAVPERGSGCGADEAS